MAYGSTKAPNPLLVELTDRRALEAWQPADEEVVAKARELKEQALLDFGMQASVIASWLYNKCHHQIPTTAIDTAAVIASGDGTCLLLYNPDFFVALGLDGVKFVLFHEARHLIPRHLFADAELRADPVFTLAGEVTINHIDDEGREWITKRTLERLIKLHRRGLDLEMAKVYLGDGEYAPVPLNALESRLADKPRTGLGDLAANLETWEKRLRSGNEVSGESTNDTDVVHQVLANAELSQLREHIDTVARLPAAETEVQLPGRAVGGETAVLDRRVRADAAELNRGAAPVGARTTAAPPRRAPLSGGAWRCRTGCG